MQTLYSENSKKKTKHWKKLEITYVIRKISYVHGSEDVILLRCNTVDPNWSIDSTQFVSKSPSLKNL